MKLTNTDAIGVFKSIKDPDLDMDIWSLGFVTAVNINDANEIRVNLSPSCPGCHLIEEMVENLKRALVAKGFARADVVVSYDGWQGSDEVRMMMGLK